MEAVNDPYRDPPKKLSPYFFVAKGLFFRLDHVVATGKYRDELRVTMSCGDVVTLKNDHYDSLMDALAAYGGAQ